MRLKSPLAIRWDRLTGFFLWSWEGVKAMLGLGDLPNTSRMSGVNEGIQAATTPNDASTQDHNDGTAAVSD